MDRSQLNLWMSAGDLCCWVACFWWMKRISSKQNSLLDKLSEQTRRIERLSKVEHDLIKEVHPQVGQIKEGMEAVIAAVKEGAEPPPARPHKG